jgi:hypothetical protein
VMGVDDLGAGQGRREPRGHRLGRVAAQPGQRAQHPDPEAAVLAPAARAGAEGDQLAVDLGGQGPGQLQRVPFSPAVQTRPARTRSEPRG